MLLPALNKAREKARAISCTSNMKQIGNFSMFYTQDNNDYLNPARDKNATTKKWYFYLAPYAGGDIPSNNDFAKHAINKIVCPTVKNANVNDGYNLTYAPNISAGAYTNALGYGCHGDWTTANKNYQVGSVKKPSGMMSYIESLCDYAFPGAVYETPTGVYVGADKYTIHNRHSNGCNMLMVDGHVETYKFTKEEQCTTEAVAREMGFWSMNY